MKRIYLWLRELRLSQQLIFLTVFIVGMFTVFTSVYLTPALQSFTNTEMYRVLHSTHESTVYYLNQDASLTLIGSFENSNDVIQAIYDVDHKTFVMSNDDEFSLEDQARFIGHLDEVTSETSDFSYTTSGSTFFSEDKDIIYCMTELDDGNVLITLLQSSYEDNFKELLLNNVVNLNIIIAIILFIILLTWVATLIHPLNQIRTYITKLKNDDPAVLTVNRRDEIGEVADALREMSAQLEKQNRDKEEMIQNISHDLKTPIATIKSYGESIKDGIYPYGTLEKSIDVIIEHADRLEKKVRSLIALNKMEYLLDDVPEGDNLKMNDVIDSVLLSLKVIRPEIVFERKMTPNVFFHGDTDPWRIVVENLLDNNLRYAQSVIRIQLSDNELIIGNDGEHIDPVTMEKMFRPYEKGTDGQFGLGMSIVYRIVTTYGYKIEASNLTNGVQFRIWREVSRKEKRAIEKERNKEKVAEPSDE